jgi:YVTN family beta-propeller protein
MSLKSTFSIFAFLFLFVACDKNNNDNPAGVWSESVFIINEGRFPTGSGTISAFNRETLEVTNDIFETANGRPLGNVVQSLTVHGDKAFIVVNNANKIEVVNLEDFKSDTTLEGITLPRYFIGFDDDKGYISCWDSTVKVINLQDYSISHSVQTGTGPEKMVLADNKLFVINSGGYGIDSTVSVINTNNEENIGRITVGHRPSGIRKDMNGNIWVLCSGLSGWPTPEISPGKLVCIDPVSQEILREIVFPDSINHPDHLVINKVGNTLYYNHPAGIFAFPISAPSLNDLPLIAATGYIYGLGYDDKEDIIYAAFPLDFAQYGWVYRYHATDGTLVDSFMVGIIPNGFWFNK